MRTLLDARVSPTRLPTPSQVSLQQPLPAQRHRLGHLHAVLRADQAGLYSGHTTGAPGSMPGSNNPSARDQAGHSSTGAGYGNNTAGAGYGNSSAGAGYGTNTASTGAGYGANTTGAGYGAGPGTGAYDNTSSTGGLTGSHHQHGTAGGLGSHGTHGTHSTHGTHADAPGAGYQGSGREGMADKVANAVPGHATGAPGSMPGSNNPDAHHGAHSSTTTGTHGTHGTHATGAGLTGTGAHGHHDSHATHGTHSTTGATGVPAGADHKPTMGEKIGGKIESMIGKATKNDAKVSHERTKLVTGFALA